MEIQFIFFLFCFLTLTSTQIIFKRSNRKIKFFKILNLIILNQYHRIPVPLSEVWCEPEVRRNILWPGSRIETVARVPCPSGTLGTGRRRCSVQGWEAPLLVECSSNWLLALVSELPFTPDTSSLTLTLHTNIQKLNLYGGDIKVILELMETSLQRRKLKKNMFLGRFRDQSLSQFSQVLSFLLERESLAAWMDLSPTSFEALRTRLLEVLQELCLSLYPENPNLLRSSLRLDPENLKPGAEPYSFIFPNFGKFYNSLNLHF